MSGNGEKTIVKDLAQLGEAMKQKSKAVATDGIPDVASLGIKGADELKAEAEAAAARAEKASEYLEAVPEIVEKILSVLHEMAGSEAAKKASEQLSKYVLDVEGDIRMPARWLYASVYVPHAVKYGPNFREVIRHFEELGLVKRAETGKPTGKIRLPVGNDLYVPGRFPREQEEVVLAVFQQLYDLSKISSVRRGKEIDELKNNFRAGCSGSMEDLLAGKPGDYVLYVPKGSYTDKGGNQRTLFGGDLKVSSNGKSLVPLDTFGNRHFRNSIAEARTIQVRLPISCIGQERLNLKKRLPEAEFNAARNLHGALNRAHERYLYAQKKRQEAEEAEAQATVTYQEFLLDGAEGVGFVRHYIFEHNERTHRHAWALVERKEGKLTLLKTNKDKLFEDCSDPVEEGENFSGVNQPLGRFLRWAKTKAQRAKEKAEAEENQEQYRQWAEEAKAEAEEEVTEE